MSQHTTAQLISVIGVGRLGICMALCLEKAGYQVLGVDVSQDYIDQINQKTLDSPEPLVNEYLKKSQNFRATTDLKEALDFSDIYFLVAPTNTIPEVESYDHRIMSQILSDINSYKVKNKHIVISSTVFPGYISKTAKNLVQDCENITLNYNPEFIAQGDIIQGLLYPDIVLIGEGSEQAGNAIASIYQKMCKNSPSIEKMSTDSAEITKLAINCFITAKIAFANLVGDIADETAGADKIAILNAVGKDRRIGLASLKPGYGFGGPCFPRDNIALGNYATLLGIEPVLFRATDKANQLHADYQAQKLLEQNLDEYVFEGVCYKSDSPVPIIENSPKLVIAQKLAEQGKDVVILDIESVITKVKNHYSDLFSYKQK